MMKMTVMRSTEKVSLLKKACNLTRMHVAVKDDVVALNMRQKQNARIFSR